MGNKSTVALKEDIVEEIEDIEVYILPYRSFGVGKTSLMLQFVGGDLEKANSYNEDIESRIITLGNNNITVNVYDTRGDERFPVSVRRYYKRSQPGVLLVFDLTDAETFEDCKHYMNELQIYGKRNFILVGNKCELEPCEGLQQKAQDFAQQNEMIYIETSAHQNIRVDEAFYRIVVQTTGIEYSCCSSRAKSARK